MSRILVLLFASALFGYAAAAQLAPAYDTADETRAALEQAVAERDAAQRRSERLEREAEESADEAERTAREVAALAARIQQAEAGIAAAEARSALIGEERAKLHLQLGEERRPIVSLTAALQQFARRPVALSILRPGDVQDLVYLRAVMANTVPEVEQRTASLKQRIDRTRQLEREAVQAADVLRAEEQALAARREELATIEARQRLAAREAGSIANREAERALALAEQARDLDTLAGELERAADLRNQLAALPGPVLRPGSGLAVSSAREPLPAPAQEQDRSAPSPYVLPVTGRAVTGFGAQLENGLSQGVILAPRANAQVVAPAAGRVAFSGPYRGYGQIVILEHKGGWSSVITGLARSDVAVGEALVDGAPIGVAGPGRPTISLELRQGGTPVNPLDFTQ